MWISAIIRAGSVLVQITALDHLEACCPGAEIIPSASPFIVIIIHIRNGPHQEWSPPFQRQSDFNFRVFGGVILKVCFLEQP